MEFGLTDVNDIFPDLEKAFSNRFEIVLNKNEFINWDNKIIDLSKQDLPGGVL